MFIGIPSLQHPQCRRKKAKSRRCYERQLQEEVFVLFAASQTVTIKFKHWKLTLDASASVTTTLTFCLTCPKFKASTSIDQPMPQTLIRHTHDQGINHALLIHHFKKRAKDLQSRVNTKKP